MCTWRADGSIPGFLFFSASPKHYIFRKLIFFSLLFSQPIFRQLECKKFGICLPSGLTILSVQSALFIMYRRMPLFFNLSSWKIATIDILNQNSKLFNVREEKKRRKLLAMINSGWLLYKWPFFSGFFMIVRF